MKRSPLYLAYVLTWFYAVASTAFLSISVYDEAKCQPLSSSRTAASSVGLAMSALLIGWTSYRLYFTYEYEWVAPSVKVGRPTMYWESRMDLPY